MIPQSSEEVSELCGTAELAAVPPEAAPDSVYHVLWAGRFHGLQIVADGNGVRETLDDPVSIHFPLPQHLWQIDLDFGEETNL